MTPLLLSLQIGRPATEGIPGSKDTLTKLHVTAIRKKPVTGPVRVLADLLEGDAVANQQLHGGDEKAICAYPSEHYPHWQRVLGTEKPREFGAFGENFTTQGLLETDLCIGDVFSVGSALISVTEPRQPCLTLSRHWLIKDFARMVSKAGFTGWYFRVVQQGEVQAGNHLLRVERPYPQWSVARANDIMYGREKNATTMQALASCPALSGDWRRQLVRKLGQNQKATHPELPLQ